MSYVFTDVNEAFPIMWHKFWENYGDVIEEPSRNGPVRRFVYPVTTIFKEPCKRVLMNKWRDCNPFFHLFEAIWMLDGRNDVAYLARFNKRMMDYSDDGLTLVSSYGYRWKNVLPTIIERLRTDPSSRRAFIPIFERADAFRIGKDIPCNVGISFYIRDGRLDMTVFNRSNDMVYGAYGANVVHFSFLQEYVAAAVDVEVGYYAQISSNFHLYTEFDVTKRMKDKIDPHPMNPYETVLGITPSPYHVLTNYAEIDEWHTDAGIFLDEYSVGDPSMFVKSWRTPFFAMVAAPMYRTWHAFVKNKNVDGAFATAELIEAPDWRYSAFQWMQNRIDSREKAIAQRA